MNSIRLYDLVEIVSSQFAESGVMQGTRGYVIEDHGDGSFEVEISDPTTGVTLATIVAKAADLRVIDGSSGE